MNYTVRTEIPRSENDASICKKLVNLGVATVAEAQNKQGVIEPTIRPILDNKTVAGVAVTVKCFDADNLMLHTAIDLCKRGDILVVSTNQETRNGYFGELMATACMLKGTVGLIIDGGVRDTKVLKKIGFPVWSKYVCVTGTSKKNPGWVNIDIVLGGVLVHPGDYVLADDDGIVIISRDSIDETLKRASERQDKEIITREKLRNGESSLDFYDLRKTLKDSGVEYI